jgi:hypothetical protein
MKRVMDGSLGCAVLLLIAMPLHAQSGVYGFAGESYGGAGDCGWGGGVVVGGAEEDEGSRLKLASLRRGNESPGLKPSPFRYV